MAKKISGDRLAPHKSNSKGICNNTTRTLRQQTAIQVKKRVANKISYLLTYICDIPVMKSITITNSTQ